MTDNDNIGHACGACGSIESMIAKPVVCDYCGSSDMRRFDRGIFDRGGGIVWLDCPYCPPRDLSRVAVRTCPISGLESHR